MADSEFLGNTGDCGVLFGVLVVIVSIASHYGAAWIAAYLRGVVDDVQDGHADKYDPHY